MTIIDNDLLSIQEARILAENAFQAQKKLSEFSQQKLDEIVCSVAKTVERHSQKLAAMSSDETGYGNWEDKWLKNRFVCNFAFEHLLEMRCVGIISNDERNKIIDIGVPVGVIVSLCPSTSPVSTTIYNTLIALKSGNSIIFSPHPRARKTLKFLIDIMIDAALANGLPEGCLTYLNTVTYSGTIELMRHKSVSLILNSGVFGMLDDAYKTGKPVIYGGTGNGPAFIERSADIEQAVSDIVSSKTFDNGIVSSAEHSIIVDGCIEDKVSMELEKKGAYFMTEEESHIFSSLFFLANGKLNPQLVGLSAKKLAQRAGFCVPENVSLLIARRKYVSANDPYTKEMLCPVLTYYVEDDWMHACEKCIELLLSERNGHTLVIHSNDESVIRQFALKKPVARILVNTPATFGGIGATTNLFPSMTLGSGSAGQGITSDNVSPLNLIYIRKVGYGIRRAEFIKGDILKDLSTSFENSAQTKVCNSNNMQLLQHILKEAVQVMDSQKNI
jgi:acetaldehyde dehydrogenase (acetylating)